MKKPTLVVWVVVVLLLLVGCLDEQPVAPKPSDPDVGDYSSRGPVIRIAPTGDPDIDTPAIRDAMQQAGPGDVILLQAGVFSVYYFDVFNFRGHLKGEAGPGGKPTTQIVAAQGLLCRLRNADYTPPDSVPVGRDIYWRQTDDFQNLVPFGALITLSGGDFEISDLVIRGGDDDCADPDQPKALLNRLILVGPANEIPLGGWLPANHVGGPISVSLMNLSTEGSNVGIGLPFEIDLPARRIVIRDSEFRSNRDLTTALFVGGLWEAPEVSITGNRIVAESQLTGGSGLDVEIIDGGNVSIEGNSVYAGRLALFAADDWFPYGAVGEPTSFRISNNTISTDGDGLGIHYFSSGGAGIQEEISGNVINGGRRSLTTVGGAVSIRDNEFINSAPGSGGVQFGIFSDGLISGTNRNTIKDNRIRGAYDIGIYIRGATGTEIRANEIDLANPDAIGLYVRATTGCFVTDNDVFLAHPELRFLFDSRSGIPTTGCTVRQEKDRVDFDGASWSNGGGLLNDVKAAECYVDGLQVDCSAPPSATLNLEMTGPTLARSGIDDRTLEDLEAEVQDQFDSFREQAGAIFPEGVGRR